MSSSSERNPDEQLEAAGQTIGDSGKAGLAANVNSDVSQSGFTGLGVSERTSSVESGHQRLVFTDPVAFRYSAHLRVQRYICG